MNKLKKMDSMDKEIHKQESSQLFDQKNKNIQDRSNRHPEKQRNESTYAKKPSWIRIRVKNNDVYKKTTESISSNRVRTVCEEAACPNLQECWSKSHASFILLGDICTRACSFCNIATGKPLPPDKYEPLKTANTVASLKLKHVVLTSVDRDDLPDRGAGHFADTISCIRYKSPGTTIEILTPDFLENYKIVMDSAPPDVFNHNIETVPRLYPKVRPGSRYFRSLNLLNSVKEYYPSIFTKSGMMVGLGEDDNEIYQVMDDLRSAKVDFLTIGQYLQPTPKHNKIYRFVTPEMFEKYKKVAYAKGFTMVSSSPLTRSSYHADSDFEQLKRQRLEKLQATN